MRRFGRLTILQKLQEERPIGWKRFCMIVGTFLHLQYESHIASPNPSQQRRCNQKCLHLILHAAPSRLQSVSFQRDTVTPQLLEPNRYSSNENHVHLYLTPSRHLEAEIKVLKKPRVHCFHHSNRGCRFLLARQDYTSKSSTHSIPLQRQIEEQALVSWTEELAKRFRTQSSVYRLELMQDITLHVMQCPHDARALQELSSVDGRKPRTVFVYCPLFMQLLAFRCFQEKLKSFNANVKVLVVLLHPCSFINRL